MNSLLVFIKPENFLIDIFIKDQSEDDDVEEVQVMSCTEDKMFIFALITYKNERAITMAIDFFRFTGMFTQRVTLKKSEAKTTIIAPAATMNMSVPRNLLAKVEPHKLEITKEEFEVVVEENFEQKCIDIFEKYQNTENLDHVTSQLFHDSFISKNHEIFVQTLLIKGLSDGPSELEEIGILFAKIIMEKTISFKAINDGIDAVLKNWSVHILSCPHFFFYISTTIAILILTCTSYDIRQLKSAFKSISSEVSSVLMIELTKTIVEYTDKFNNNKNLSGIIWLYNKWTISEYTSLDTFLSCEELNKYFKNDRFGVFFLSILLHDHMKHIELTKIYSLMCTWISQHINRQIINDPLFVRALAIAAVFINLENNVSCTKFFNYITGELLVYFIKSKPFETDQIQAREVQCLYGIQIAAAVISNPPKDLVFNLFSRLHQETIVSSESFKIWKDENQLNYKFVEDQETKKKALESFDWNDLLIKFASHNSNE